MSEETPKNDKDIEFKVPDTSITEAATQTTENIEFEKYKMKMNFLKWVLGTFAIAVMTIIIQWGFKDRAVGMNEISQYDRYTTDLLVLNDNPVKKRMLAQFFSTVTPSNKLKCGWQDYYKEVNEEYLKFIAFDSVTRAKYKLMNKDTTKMSSNQVAKLKETEMILKRLDSIKNAPIIIPESNIDSSINIPTIYIQYSNKIKKDEVTTIQKTFNEHNWKAPGIEFKEKGCDNSIRYFRDEDREIANLANTLLDNKYNIKKVNYPSPKGQIEIWIDNK